MTNSYLLAIIRYRDWPISCPGVKPRGDHSVNQFQQAASTSCHRRQAGSQV